MQITILHNLLQNQILIFTCVPVPGLCYLCHSGEAILDLYLLFAAQTYSCLIVIIFCFTISPFCLIIYILSLDFTLLAHRWSNVFFPYSLCFAALNKIKFISPNGLPFAFIIHVLPLIQLDFLFFRRSLML